MSSFSDYQQKYPNFRLERDEQGIVLVTLHTNGGPLVMTDQVHRDLGFAFADLGADRGNRVLILTGAGDTFCAEAQVGDPQAFTTTHGVDRVFEEAVRRDTALLDLPIPIVAAVNGPALVHADIPLLGDIVLAADTATFRDFHLPGGLVPGGIAQVIWQELLGPVRANYFLLTGQTLSAAEALTLGVVNEVLPPAQLLPRAWEHARWLAAQTTLTLRSARYGINQRLRQRVQREAPYGYALIGVGALDAALQARTPAASTPI